MIIDAHAHIFDRVKGLVGAGRTDSLAFGRVRLGRAKTIRLVPPLVARTALPPEVLLELMDWAGVDKAVLLQAPFYGDHNDYVQRAVRRWPDRFIGAAAIDPWSIDAQAALMHVTDELGFGAVKLEMSMATGLTGLHPEACLDDPGMAWFWAHCECRRLVVTLDLGPVGGLAYQTRGLRTIVCRHPALKVVIAHLAHPPQPGEDGELSFRSGVIRFSWHVSVTSGLIPQHCQDPRLMKTTHLRVPAALFALYLISWELRRSFGEPTPPDCSSAVRMCSC